MPAQLWHIEVSHYSEKARWALDYKGIPYRLRTPLAGMHGAVALALTRGAQRRLPVLDLDGQRIGDSTAIIEALEAYRPDPPLYPDDPGDRARALELEDFFDEQLAPDLRRFVWHHTLPDADAVVDSVWTGAGPTRRRVMRTLVPVFRPGVRMDYGVSEERAARSLEKIHAAMDRLERELQPGGYLVGDRFSVADLTAAALFTPVVAPPERPFLPLRTTPPISALRAELEAREGGRWVTEMYARHRGGPAAQAPNAARAARAPAAERSVNP